ncbi:UNVERIFIED_CONTAM: hypothetical protein RMT77_016615 [Armadillidium vulgare]
MVKCDNLCRCFEIVFKIIQFNKLNGLKILEIILRNSLRAFASLKISNARFHIFSSVMQCFPCLGSRSQDDLTDCGSRNSSYKLASHLVYKKERIAKGESRFTEGPPLCPSHPPTEPPTSLFSDSSLTLSSRTRSKRSRFWKSLKKVLCICGRRNESCTQLSWGFRRDYFGRVPVAMDTPNVSRINSRFSLHREDLICNDADGLAPYDQPCNEPCNQTPEGSGVDLPCDDRLQDSSNFCSVETGGGSSHGRGDSPWCKLLYWEENEIRSRVFNVWDPAINVLGDTPHGSGWSLSTFFNTPAKTEKISRVRAKICQGLILWREGKAVWVYNRSKTPVYLNSASLDGTFFNLNLYKCPPGYAMIIYYYEMARELMGRLDYKLRRKCDTTDVNSVRISFAKGWGKDYHRRQILCCPCWIEVHVVPTLKIEQRAPHR